MALSTLHDRLAGSLCSRIANRCDTSQGQSIQKREKKGPAFLLLCIVGPLLPSPYLTFIRTKSRAVALSAGEHRPLCCPP